MPYDDASFYRQSFRAFIENSSDLIARLARDSTHLYANPAFAKALNLPMEAILGKTNADLGVPAELVEQFDAMRENVFKTKENVSFEIEYPAKDGVGYFRIQLIPEFDADGEVNTILSISHDITDQKHAEEALRISEERYRIALDASLDAFYLLESIRDENGDIVDFAFVEVNSEGLSQTSTTREQIIGESIRDLYPINHTNGFFNEYKQVALTGEPLTQEYHINSDTGGSKWYHHQVVKVGDGVAIFNRDISKEKWLEDLTLRQSKDALVKAQRIAHLGSWEVNMQTGETVWSDEFFRICGINPQKHRASVELGMSIIHPEDLPRVQKAFDQSGALGKPYNIENRIIRPDGEVRWVESQGEISLDDEGKPLKLTGVFLDITDRKLAEERTFELALEKERLNILTQFINSLAHEIRTPLTIINSNAYMLSKNVEAEVRQAKANKIEAQVMHITRMMEMLMLMMRVENCDGSNHTLVNLDTIYEASRQYTVTRYGNQPIIECEKPIALPPVMAESDYLLEAFNQILDNAFRYTPPDGRVFVQAGIHDNDVWFTFTDTGIGIPSENMPHVFKTFWRGDKAQTTRGLGLGLSLSKQIIEHFGGTIQLKSEVGQGTQVRITLPIPSA